MKTKAKEIGILFIITVLAIFAYTACSRPSIESPKIKVGAILPLTGDQAVFGEEIRNTINMAVDDMHKLSGEKIEVLYEDNKGVPMEAVTAYNKLVNVQKANIIISFLTPYIESIIPLAERDNILLIGLTIYPGVANNAVTIRIFYDVFSESKKITDYISNVLKLKKVTFVRCSDAASEYQVREYLIPMLKEKGIEVYRDITYNLGEKDFKKIIPPLPDYVEGIIILGFGIDFPGVLKELNKYNYLKTKKIVGGVGFWEIPDDCPTELLDGIVFAAPSYLPSLSDMDFSKRYYQVYKKLPYYISPYVYDNIRILYDAILRINTDKLTGTDLKRAITELDHYNGISGQIEILSNGDSRVPVSLVSYEMDRKLKIILP